MIFNTNKWKQVNINKVSYEIIQTIQMAIQSIVNRGTVFIQNEPNSWKHFISFKINSNRISTFQELVHLFVL